MSSVPQWRALLEQSAAAYETSKMSKRESAKYLWLGARAAIRAWRPATDPTGERLYRKTLIALGGARKGSASKIKTVALATKEFPAFNLDAYGSLNAAYQAAQRIAAGEEFDLDPICACAHCTYHHGPTTTD